MAINLKVLTPDDWYLWRELRLQALAEAPYAFGSRLADWEHAPEMRWRERLELPGSHNVIACLGEHSVGMVTGLPLESGLHELISMWVAPLGRGQGVGDALITEVTGWARASDSRELHLDVLEYNAHAIRLYTRHGFIDTGRSSGAGERRMVKVL